MESPPLEDPEEGNRPIGALATVTAAVRHPEFIMWNPSHLRINQSG